MIGQNSEAAEAATKVTLFDDDGQPVAPLRYDASLTLDAMDMLRLWEVLRVASDSNAIYSDTAEWLDGMLVKLYESLEA